MYQGGVDVTTEDIGLLLGFRLWDLVNYKVCIASVRHNT